MCLTNVGVCVIPPLGMIRQMTFLLSELSAALTMVKVMMIGDKDIATGDDDHDNCVDDHTGNDIDDD